MKFRLSVRSKADPEGETLDRIYDCALDALNAAITSLSAWEKRQGDDAIEFKITKTMEK